MDPRITLNVAQMVNIGILMNSEMIVAARVDTPYVLKLFTPFACDLFCCCFIVNYQLIHVINLPMIFKVTFLPSAIEVIMNDEWV